MSARKETTFDRRKREREARIQERIAKISTAPRKPFTSEDIDQAMATSYTPIIAQEVDFALTIDVQSRYMQQNTPRLPEFRGPPLRGRITYLKGLYPFAYGARLLELLQKYEAFPTNYTKHLICRECARQKGQEHFEAVFNLVCSKHLVDRKIFNKTQDALCSMAEEASVLLHDIDARKLIILLIEWLLHSEKFTRIDIGILMHAWRNLTEQPVQIYQLWSSVLEEYVGTYRASQVPPLTKHPHDTGRQLEETTYGKQQVEQEWQERIKALSDLEKEWKISKFGKP